jgi:hypothetical protein
MPWPVAALDRQAPGQTMAVGAIARCLKQYGETTLITALHCVTQTVNKQAGALSARMIKALCDVLHRNPELRDSGLALLEAFDSIDLMAIQDASAVDAAVKKVGRVQAMADRIHAELSRLLPQKAGAQKTAGREASGDDRNVPSTAVLKAIKAAQATGLPIVRTEITSESASCTTAPVQSSMVPRTTNGTARHDAYQAALRAGVRR